MHLSYKYSFILLVTIFCTHMPMGLPPANTQKQVKAALQEAIKQDSVEKFLNCLPLLSKEESELKAFKSALKQKAQKITHSLPSQWQDKLLLLAAKHGSVTAIQFLTQLDTYQYSPITDKAFTKALKVQDFKSAKLLLDKGANINCYNKSDKKTLLHHFISEDESQLYISIIKWLLHNGADPDLRSEKGEVPLHDNGNTQIIELLCDHGANPNERDFYFGDTPLTDFLQCGNPPDNIIAMICVQLLAAGVDINAQNKTGQTALHIAARTNLEIAALILLAMNVNREILDIHERTAYACARTDRMRQILLSSPQPTLPEAARLAQKKIDSKKIKIA